MICKKLILFSSFLVMSASIAMGANEKTTTTPQTLKVIVEGLSSGKGQVGLTLFNKENASDYPIRPQKALLETYLPLNGQTRLEINLERIPEGNYAAFVYHDENSDHKINTNLIKIPTEGYAASKGAINRFGPPKYDDAQFNVKYGEPQGSTVIIKMKY